MCIGGNDWFGRWIVELSGTFLVGPGSFLVDEISSNTRHGNRVFRHTNVGHTVASVRGTVFEPNGMVPSGVHTNAVPGRADATHAAFRDREDAD